MNDSFNNIVWPGWETVRFLGQGGFGAVYEIQRPLVGGTLEKAALKVISIPQNSSDLDEMFSDGQTLESVTKIIYSHMESVVAEYSIMRKMNDCVNVVSCDNVRCEQHDDRIGWDVFIKMELLTPLTNALSAEIEEHTVLKIAKDLCNALVVCKRNNIVHRDIKPQNIFVSQHGDYKLGDFGIAKIMEKTTGATKIGTYRYMAPEVYNNQPYGSTSDIYSLGLVLYWLLNERRLPFLPLPPAMIGVGMDEDARLRRLKGDKLPKPAHGSEGLKAIVMKACEYNPKKRYQSASEMLEALNNLDSKKSSTTSKSGDVADISSTAKGKVAATSPVDHDFVENDDTVLDKKVAPEGQNTAATKKKLGFRDIASFFVFLAIFYVEFKMFSTEVPIYVVVLAIAAQVALYILGLRLLKILDNKQRQKMSKFFAKELYGLERFLLFILTFFVGIIIIFAFAVL